MTRKITVRWLILKRGNRQKYLDHFRKSRYLTNNYFSAQGEKISSKEHICGIIRNIPTDECVGVTEGDETDFWQLSVSRSNCGDSGHNIFCYNATSRNISMEGVDGMFVDRKQIKVNTPVGLRAGNATPWRLKETGFIQSETTIEGMNCWRKDDDQITLSTCDGSDSLHFDFQVQKTGTWNLLLQYCLALQCYYIKIN